VKKWAVRTQVSRANCVNLYGRPGSTEFGDDYLGDVSLQDDGTWTPTYGEAERLLGDAKFDTPADAATALERKMRRRKRTRRSNQKANA